MNGAPEPWLRKDAVLASGPNLDLDSILGGFPGYIKNECFSYDDSGFGTDHTKDEIVGQQQQHQQLNQSETGIVTTTNIVLTSSLDGSDSFQNNNNNNNNNDWQMTNHNTEQVRIRV